MQTATNTAVATYDNISGILTSIPTATPSIPSGCILLWSGSTGSIPSGFLLCDGTNGTPDLRNSFIVGAGNNYTVGQTGGSADAIVVNHTHTATSTVSDPGHSHSIGASMQLYGSPSSFLVYTQIGNVNTGSVVTGVTVATTNTSTGTSGTGANLPPYYALAYIMKT